MRPKAKIGSLSESRNRPERLQKRLLNFIGKFADWDVRADHRYVECARSLAEVLLEEPAGGLGPVRRWGQHPPRCKRRCIPYRYRPKPDPYLLNETSCQARRIRR